MPAAGGVKRCFKHGYTSQQSCRQVSLHHFLHPPACPPERLCRALELKRLGGHAAQLRTQLVCLAVVAFGLEHCPLVLLQGHHLLGSSNRS